MRGFSNVVSVSHEEVFVGCVCLEEAECSEVGMVRQILGSASCA